MRCISSILTSQNKKILLGNEKQNESNCRDKDECPLENKCLTARVIYEADVITLNTSRNFCIALSDTPFKERFNNHKRYFRNKRCEKSTKLLQFTKQWKILSHIKGMAKRGYCSLCLT